MGFVGKMFINVSFREGASGAEKVLADSIFIPAPGLKNEAINKALHIANDVVSIYRKADLKPIDPNCVPELTCPTPQTRETKTKGTTRSFKRFIKIWPITSNNHETR